MMVKNCLCESSVPSVKDITSGNERGISMAKYRQLEEYNHERESISSYLERVSLYFTANDVKEEKQVAISQCDRSHNLWATMRPSSASKVIRQEPQEAL